MQKLFIVLLLFSYSQDYSMSRTSYSSPTARLMTVGGIVVTVLATGSLIYAKHSEIVDDNYHFKTFYPNNSTLSSEKEYEKRYKKGCIYLENQMAQKSLSELECNRLYQESWDTRATLQDNGLNRGSQSLLLLVDFDKQQKINSLEMIGQKRPLI